MKIAVGISGGVDSAVAALLLQQQGHDLVGVTMSLGRADEERSLAEARAVAAKLNIPLEIRDLSTVWSADILHYVRQTYRGGQTPNPCVRCNELVKFGLLPRWAFEELGCDRFATGHYARILSKHRDTEVQSHQTGDTGEVHLLRAVDRSKDQSYFLYRVSPEILARTIFPLGELTKTEVRELARKYGFEAADREDSQDFCGGDPMALVGAEDREGDIVTADGKVIGKHRGFWHYTVGKRKGLGIGGGTPYYVLGLDAAHNRVIVGFKPETFRYALDLVDTVGEIDQTLPVKVRSAGEPKLLKDGIAGIAPGQSAVFYRGDEVVGGGIIA